MHMARPLPSAFGSRLWHMMPSSTSDSCARICDCWCAGNTSMMRLMVEDRRVGVQRAEGQVAGFGDAQRGFDGFQVAHFADQHHVRVFTKGGAQRVGKALGVGVHFALVDQAVLVHVHEFDRILDGEDVFVALGVDLVDHGRQRGGFAGAGRPGHQHQAARLVAQLADHRGQSQLVERLDLKRNQTEDARRSRRAG